MSAGELLDRGDVRMIERGYAYASAKQEAERISLEIVQQKIGDKDTLGTVKIAFLLSRLLANAK